MKKTKKIELKANEAGYISQHTGPNRHQVRVQMTQARKGDVLSGRGFKKTGKSGGSKLDRKAKAIRKTSKSSVQRNRLTKAQRNSRRDSLKRSARGTKA